MHANSYYYWHPSISRPWICTLTSFLQSVGLGNHSRKASSCPCSRPPASMMPMLSKGMAETNTAWYQWCCSHLVVLPSIDCHSRCIDLYIQVVYGDTESGHCQGACRSQWFFYIPLQRHHHLHGHANAKPSSLCDLDTRTDFLSQVWHYACVWTVWLGTCLGTEAVHRGEEVGSINNIPTCLLFRGRRPILTPLRSYIRMCLLSWGMAMRFWVADMDNLQSAHHGSVNSRTRPRQLTLLMFLHAKTSSQSYSFKVRLSVGLLVCYWCHYISFMLTNSIISSLLGSRRQPVHAPNMLLIYKENYSMSVLSW